ncbi:hypothetical protein [Chryseolinea lacunae]|uniref:Uncharacterized protein n=1 Tax=Chryseolinea lacunae TaxID=2801331 RepID=A0ABS1KTH3_9BACT|nr:hypothetical protein [Chryseolinea lacunae]MBL0742769.1 hypothetical protein [Chryseolinea lacunae]
MKEYTLTSTFGDRPRKLILSHEHIRYENKDLVADAFTTLKREDITGFKHRVDTIVWYRFPVGRRFIISLRGRNNTTITISFASYFGLQKQSFQWYTDIVETLWEYYIQPQVDHLAEIFHQQHTLTLGSLHLDANGLHIPPAPALRWDDLGLREYETYFALYKISNPQEHLRVGFDDWDAEVMLSLVRHILDHRKNASLNTTLS